MEPMAASELLMSSAFSMLVGESVVASMVAKREEVDLDNILKLPRAVKNRLKFEQPVDPRDVEEALRR